MKNPTLITMIASVLLSAGSLCRAAEKKALPADLPPFGADKPLPVPAIAQSKLPNGLSVWLVKRSGFPRAAVVLALRGAGSAADPSGADGLTGLLAAAVKEGTATRTSRAIAEELQSVGAEIDASGTADALYVTTGGLGAGSTAEQVVDYFTSLLVQRFTGLRRHTRLNLCLHLYQYGSYRGDVTLAV